MIKIAGSVKTHVIITNNVMGNGFNMNYKNTNIKQKQKVY